MLLGSDDGDDGCCEIDQACPPLLHWQRGRLLRQLIGCTCFQICWDAETLNAEFDDIYMVISSCFFIFKVNLLTAQNTHTLIVTIGDHLGPIWTFLDHLWTRGTLCFTKKLFFSERVQKAVTISNHSCCVFLWDLNSDMMTEKRMERCPLKSQEHWIKHQIKIQTKANR